MAQKSSYLRFKPRAKPPSIGVDGHSMHNEILLGLPRKECEAVLEKVELLEMRTHEVLNEMGEPIGQCYFVNSGLASILTVLSDGKSVEVGLGRRVPSICARNSCVSGTTSPPIRP